MRRFEGEKDEKNPKTILWKQDRYKEKKQLIM